MKISRTIKSFNYAVEGIIYALRKEKNMKIHFFYSFSCTNIKFVFNFSRLEFLILFFTISLVIITEMINTAIEKVVDMYTDKYNPLAKIAKDVAAGAVLIASINAIVVAYLLFFDRVNPLTSIIINKIKNSHIHLTFISIILVILITIYIKTKNHSGTPFMGGIISGHSAIGFSIATSITFITKDALVTTLSYLIALLVAESRVELKIHSFKEVVFGGILGMLMTILIFQMIG
ncbi:diacylglycerol kinase DgkA [Gottschalkia acidurici 9a]|uniref:Diacylglycerol kinase DgkA n=1 Tax=Gottschalkia acidurici (strain ATCC 7906 / DSM 604 / BCRC 14475 / CIP 104303 / KCTC 5404 / NCIMB 10678 / 9a) TaxID=1128398 RepID=K0B2I0_GOTA9|nr:diacylglycerol kinase [Gottschalkia acidurici]AFS78821.1 diacylglycerol kinase DgkA [Gottschalkia acidurici 9a]